MHLVVILLLFLNSTSAEILTKLSVHYTDVLKIKCDALPYRTVYSDRSCYFVIDSESDVATTARQCSKIFPGSQFTRPLNVPEKVWDSLFVDDTLFLSNSASRGKTKAMCVYESQLPSASTVAPKQASNAGGKAVCFRKQRSTAKDPLDRPKVIDEYHCKLICAERDECLSYIFYDRQCSLFGSKTAAASSVTSSCGARISSGCEWAKKTVISDCPDNIPQPAIDFFGYTPYPVLTAGGAVPISIKNMTFNDRRSCPWRAAVHVLLPDNSHRVQGSYNGAIKWDEKLGAWNFRVHQDWGSTHKVIPYYIRSARCYDVNPTRFADTRTCGGILPELRINATGTNKEFERTGPVRKYGVIKFCATQFVFSTDSQSSEYNHPTYNMVVYCVNGTWMLHTGWPVRPDEASTAVILRGVCAEWIDKRRVPKY